MRKGGEKDGNGLTFKQRKFVEFYVGIANGNATKAARMAGYQVPKEQGYENLTKPHIRAAIEERLNAVSLSTNEILALLSAQARADFGDFHDLIPDVEDKVDLKKAKRRGISRLIRKIGQVELVDSQAALDKLARIHGLYKENIDIGTSKPFETLIIEHGGGEETGAEGSA